MGHQQHIYSQFDKSYSAPILQSLFHDKDFKGWLLSQSKNIKSLPKDFVNKNKWLKAETRGILIEIIENQETFGSFLKLLGDDTFNAIYNIAWRGPLDKDELKINSQWRIIFQSWYKHNRYFYDVPDLIKIEIRKMMSPPKSFNLEGEKDVKTEFKFTYDDKVIGEIIVFNQAFQQDSIEFSKKDEARKSSLSKFYKQFKYQEFYPTDRKDLPQFLRSYCFFSYLYKNIGNKILEESFVDPVQNIKALINELSKCKSASDLKLWCPHLRNVDSYSLDSKVNLKILNLFKKLPKSRWVNIDDLMGYVKVNDFDIKIRNNESYSWYDIYYLKKDERYYGSNKIKINNQNEKDLMLLPILKAKSFLFASFGLFDIAYDSPINDLWKENGKEYLTIFDGLKYIRLTSLGEYVLGKTKKISNKGKQDYKIILDEKLLIVTIEGFDPAKKFYLDSIGNKLSEHKYAINLASFTKECQGLKDVINKRDIFLKTINKSPPKIWTNLFSEAVVNYRIFREENYMVFKVRDLAKIMPLIKRDEAISSMITFAESSLILIKHDDFKKVKNRLANMGMFI
jgi:hypothetical protein